MPLLIDRDGVLPLAVPAAAGALGPRAPRELLDQIELELEAQIAKMVADGIQPDHIDGERHVHLIPVSSSASWPRRVATGVPFVRVGRDMGARFVRPVHAASLLARGGFLKWWLIGTLSRRARRASGGDVRGAEQVASYLYSGRLDLLLRDLLTPTRCRASPR